MSKPAPKRKRKKYGTGEGTPPGARAYGVLFSKRAPRPASDFTDHEILSIILGSPRAAQSVLDEIEAGEGSGLADLAKIGSGKNLLNTPHISRGTAARVELLYEAARRIK